MRQLQDAQFGVVSFYGINDELGNKCGPNGLPLTPSSVQMVGRFQRLKSLEHPNLCKYLDIQRGKHEIVFVVTEYYPQSLASLISDVKLKSSIYLPPEVIVAKSSYNNSPSADIFSFGLVLLEMQLGIRVCDIHDRRRLSDFICKFLYFIEKNFTKAKLDPIDSSWLEVIEQCLMVHPSRRPTAHALQKFNVFANLASKRIPYYKGSYAQAFLSLDRTSHLESGAPIELRDDTNKLLNEPVKCRPVEEAYYLWKIAGSSIENILSKKGLLKCPPSIITLPNLLIDAYPFKKSILWHESRIDIPPIYRGLVWCGLLNVIGDVKSEYDMIDKETVTTTDRQIEVDIPRCHQYDELLSSPESHKKFKRVLKAWVVSHPEYVYWQGLDSLCAPFLYLNFNYECLAFACLKNFVPKYLHEFFLKDNSAIMQEYLVVFDHLICFHDPELYFHLNDIGFYPDLYAIPWFLTMFAHLLPLHKLFHLWDTLLLGNNSFPLCVGVAVLLQLRDRLMGYGFNECILLFSDMPEIDIEDCVTTAIKIFRETPKSAFYRHYMPPDAKTKMQQNFSIEDQRGLMEPITLAQLKAEHCPRLCANDLITIQKAKENGTSTAYFDLLCVDVRPFEEFAKGTFSYSINLPHNLLFIDGKFSLNSIACDKLRNHRNKLICIIGSNADDRRAYETAEHLMRTGYSRITILHKGIEILRQLQVLVVP